MMTPKTNTVLPLEERLRLGMFIQIREGTAAKNAAALLPQVNDKNWRRFVVFFVVFTINAPDVIIICFF